MLKATEKNAHAVCRRDKRGGSNGELDLKPLGYGSTYEKHLGFKRVVRDAYGPASKQYRRIHLRASPCTKQKKDETPDASSNG
jgi:hypothetical protein